ncbi:MAG: hypothetical protein JO072_07135 [Parafilimonas sp.]|nr:hypothetical protein [Parafilimonas sp.]
MNNIFTLPEITRLKFLFFIILFSVGYCAKAGTTRTWQGAGAGGTGTDLGTATNWSPAGVPGPTDDCIMNFVGGINGLGTNTASNSFFITQSGTFSAINSLTINFSGNGSGIKVVNITITGNLSIAGALSITNSSTGFNNHQIEFDISGGTTACGSVQTAASGAGTGNPYLYIKVLNSGAGLICNGNWTSSTLDNSTVSTYIKNSGTLTIGGVDSIYNSSLSTAPIRFLVDNNPAITTFNGRVKLGTTNKNSYTGGNNTILLGGYDAGSTGQFVFNTNNDSIILGYNMGIENFNNGTLLFIGSGSVIGSYAKSNVTPDRSPGTFQIGTSSVPATVSFVTTGDNNALAVYNLLLVNTSSTFTVLAAVIPSDVRNKATIQLNPYSTLNLGVNNGASSSLPTNYLNYFFDVTSTVNYSGNTQTVYSGTNYGNLTLSNTGTKRAGGSLTILGNVLITDNAVFDLNSNFFNNNNNFTDTVSGSWTNNSTDQSGGVTSTAAGKVTIMFNGSSNATIGGNNPNTFYGIRVDKTAGSSLTMNQNLTGTDKDSLTNGALAINGNTLTLNGTIVTTNGTISGSTTSNLIVGASGTIKFTRSGYNNYLKTFTLNSPSNATLADSLNITGSDGTKTGTFGATAGKVVTNSGAILTTNGYLTIKSDKFGDGMVGQSSGTITGNVTVERYIYPRRAWRFLAIPVTSTQTINQAWQDTAINSSLYLQTNPHPGFGTDITNGSGNEVNGFDENTTQSKPSCKYWDSAQDAWIPISTTNMPINSHAAYCIFVRGSRAINLSQGTAAIPDSTILRITGTLNQITHTQSFTGVPVGNFVMVKNPYAAPLDFTNGTFTNINNNSFYIFDPQLTGTNSVGGYNTYNSQLSPHWLITGGSYSPGSPSVVQSGQAFFMQTANGTSGSVVYKENAKSTSEFNTTGKEMPVAHATLYADLLLTNNNLALTDRIAAVYGNKYSPDDTIFGSLKFWNEDESLALWNGRHYYSVNCRPVPVLTDTLFFRMYLFRGTPYTLRIFTQNVLAELPAKGWLVDNYLHSQTEINLYDTTLYSFQTNSDTLSYRNRFMLVFNRQMQEVAFPVTKNTNQLKPGATGMNDIDVHKPSLVNIYPNPVKSNKAILMFNNMKQGGYEIIIYNEKGDKLSEQALQNTGGYVKYTIALNPSWAAGVYTLNVINKDSNERTQLKLLISR